MKNGQGQELQQGRYWHLASESLAKLEKSDKDEKSRSLNAYALPLNMYACSIPIPWVEIRYFRKKKL